MPESGSNQASRGSNFVHMVARIQVDDGLPSSLNDCLVRQLIAPEVRHAIDSLAATKAVSFHDYASRIGGEAQWYRSSQMARPIQLAVSAPSDGRVAPRAR